MASDFSESGRTDRQALVAGVLIFALTAGVGMSATWLTGQQEAHRNRVAVSQVAADRAGNLRTELTRTAAATHAIAAVLLTGSSHKTTFDKASARIVDGVGGVDCLQWAVSGRVAHAFPRDGCARLNGGDSGYFALFHSDTAGALNGPLDLPSKNTAFIARLVVRGANGAGTVSGMVDLQRVIGQAKIDTLPDAGYHFELIVPTQGDRIIASSSADKIAASRRPETPVTETPVQVDSVALVLRVWPSGGAAPVMGWAAAVVLLTALLLARMGYGFMLQVSRYNDEHRLRLRLEEKLAASHRKVSALQEERQRAGSTDSVTSLPDGRYLAHFLDRNWLTYSKAGRPIALMLVEADRLDSLQKDHGAEAAQNALRQVAKQVGKVVNDSDEIAVRVRGSTFGLFFIAGAASPSHRGEQIREAVAALKIPNAGSGIGPVLTASVGIVTGTPARLDPVRSFTSAAEEALKVAREKGHNRVVVRRWVGLASKNRA